MDGSGNYKIRYRQRPSVGLSRIQHLTWTGKILNFKTSVDGCVIMELSI
jgi:hypothetical protein